MIKLIKHILTSTILHERMLCEFKSVFSNKRKEKTYSVKLTQSNIELLVACYKYGITNKNELFKTIRKNILSKIIIQRYDIYPDMIFNEDVGSEMQVISERDENGDWVRYDDIKHLLERSTQQRLYKMPNGTSHNRKRCPKSQN